MATNCWLDGRPKVWFEIYLLKGELDSAHTLQAAINKAKKLINKKLYGSRKKISPVDLLIYEVHSRGGWNTSKDDKVLQPRSLVEFLPKKQKEEAMHELAFRCLSEGVAKDEQDLYRRLVKSMGGLNL